MPSQDLHEANKRAIRRVLEPTREDVEAALDTAILTVSNFRKRIDPGHLAMIAYLGRLQKAITRQRTAFLARCEWEDGNRS